MVDETPVLPAPRPISYSLDAVRGTNQTTGEVIKLVQLKLFHENGIDVHFLSLDFARGLNQDLHKAIVQANSGLTLPDENGKFKA